MYSGVQGRSFKWTRLFGVTQYGEIPLSANVKPFDEYRLVAAFHRMRKRPKLVSEALHYSLARYKAMQVTRILHLPPLQGLRLYEIELELDTWARNKGRPHSKKLLYEVTRVEKMD
jgi:hypothetical protein